MVNDNTAVNFKKLDIMMVSNAEELILGKFVNELRNNAFTVLLSTEFIGRGGSERLLYG